MNDNRFDTQIGSVAGNVVTGGVHGGDINFGAPAAVPAAPAADVPSPEDHSAEYHLAFTFAGEQRDFVARVKEECQDLGLDVMYDFDNAVDWWGKNFIVEQRRIYAHRTLFVVAFISKEYLAKPVPRDEFTAAMWRDVQQGGGYILPVLMDDVTVPDELLHPSTAFLRVRGGQPEPATLAVLLNQKVLASLLTNPRAPKGIADIVTDAMTRQSTPPTRTLPPVDAVLAHLRERFDAVQDDVRRLGGTLLLEPGADIWAKVVRSGDVDYELRVRRDRRVAETLVVVVNRHVQFGGEMRDQAEVLRDKYDAEPRIRLRKRGLLPGIAGEPVDLTKEELFDRIWQDITGRPR
ncbi:MAG TPA: toll/interleukin-1 receptor domain-containing protein [Pseudonocardiaceae bacterium]|jgi:hypothetical protein